MPSCMGDTALASEDVKGTAWAQELLGGDTPWVQGPLGGDLVCMKWWLCSYVCHEPEAASGDLVSGGAP